MAGMDPSRQLDEPAVARAPSHPRVNGLVALLVLVVLGVGVTAGYLQWKAPELNRIVAGRKGEVKAAEKRSPEERLAKWIEMGNPLIHNRLLWMRFSAEQPWLVTHAVGVASAGDLSIYGIDLTDMPRSLVAIDGLGARLELPRPRLLGRGPLAGGNAAFVPVFAEASAAPDPSRRGRELVEWALEGLSNALGRDIPGAELSIEVGPAASWGEIAAARDGIPATRVETPGVADPMPH